MKGKDDLQITKDEVRSTKYEVRIKRPWFLEVFQFVSRNS